MHWIWKLGSCAMLAIFHFFNLIILSNIFIAFEIRYVWKLIWDTLSVMSLQLNKPHRVSDKDELQMRDQRYPVS